MHESWIELSMKLDLGASRGSGFHSLREMFECCVMSQVFCDFSCFGVLFWDVDRPLPLVSGVIEKPSVFAWTPTLRRA